MLDVFVSDTVCSWREVQGVLSLGGLGQEEAVRDPSAVYLGSISG